jgi:hypothetical protein
LPIESVVLEPSKERESPLSWQLTDDEIRSLSHAWKKIRQEKNVQDLKNWLLEGNRMSTKIECIEDPRFQ